MNHYTMDVVVDGKVQSRDIDYVDTTVGFGPPRYVPKMLDNERAVYAVDGTTYIFKAFE